MALEFSRLDDSYLAIDSQAGFCYSLNVTAGKIWDIIENPIPFSAICERLLAEYSVPQKTCEEEVWHLLVSLRDSGLITLTND